MKTPKKTAKLITLTLALALILALAASCAAAPAETSPSPVAASPTPVTSATPEPEATPTPDTYYPLTITDMMGLEVTISKPVEKAIVLTAGDAEIVYALGKGDIVIGRGAYCDYPEEILSLPSLESGYETNVEQIIAMQPDIVFLGTMNQSAAQIQQIKDAGIPVVVSNAQTIEETYTAIEMIGKALNVSDEAEEIITGMKAAFASLSAMQPDPGKTVYIEVSSLVWGTPWTAGKGSFMDDIVTVLGLTNIFSDLDGAWAEVSEEQIIERNPDYIVTVRMYYGDDQPDEVEEISSRAGWENVTAVKNGAIYLVADDSMTRPAPRLVNGATDLANFILEHKG